LEASGEALRIAGCADAGVRCRNELTVAMALSGSLAPARGRGLG
jgi:hypothetical protein